MMVASGLFKQQVLHRLKSWLAPYQSLSLGSRSPQQASNCRTNTSFAPVRSSRIASHIMYPQKRLSSSFLIFHPNQLLYVPFHISVQVSGGSSPLSPWNGNGSRRFSFKSRYEGYPLRRMDESSRTLSRERPREICSCIVTTKVVWSLIFKRTLRSSSSPRESVPSRNPVLLAIISLRS